MHEEAQNTTENGILQQSDHSKKNSIYDVCQSLEFLIQKKYTSANKIALSGRSSGGLLLAAMLNYRPDLLNLAIIGVPLIDLLNHMSQKFKIAVQSHYDEYGNPEIDSDFDYMSSYCPYQNIKRQNYPHIYLYGAVHDLRVSIAELVRWTIKMRETKTDSNYLVFNPKDGSHSFTSLSDSLDIFSFMLNILG